MAITKVLPITINLWYSVTYAANARKTGLDGVVDYVINPNKSEQRLLQSCLNCSSLSNAYSEMCETKATWGKTDGVLGYHFIQAFKPGEITPEQVHEIGRQFAKECFGDRFEVVIGTHLDKDHYHNHIVINSVSCVDGEKYHSSPASYYNKIRAVSDRMCRENNLSVIEPKGKGKHYAEWKAEKEGKPTIRGQMREEFDEIIKCSYTMKDFWRNLEQRGYIIKRKPGKSAHPSVLPPFGKYPVRFDGLGKGYSLDEIQERIIAARNGIKTATPTELSKNGFDFDKAYKHIEPTKLKGFVALYYHYLYLFGKIKKKQTPQRVSFFMRDELIKLDRYQKQFKFLYENNIESVADLTEYHAKTKVKIDELVAQRKQLYTERTEENTDEVKDKAKKINAELRILRGEMRLCENIYHDAERITEKKKHADELQQQADKEVMQNEHKRRSR